jgi:hypothetical protein
VVPPQAPTYIIRSDALVEQHIDEGPRPRAGLSGRKQPIA